MAMLLLYLLSVYCLTSDFTFIPTHSTTPLSLIYTMILNPSENPILFYVSRRYFSHNSHKNTNLTTDYRFFDIPQPASASEKQVFQQFLALAIPQQ